jgi:S1-C subfamily serine protease
MAPVLFPMEGIVPRPLVALVLAYFYVNSAFANTLSPKVIYGNDDRKDLYQVDAATAALSDATVAVMSDSDIKQLGAKFRLQTVPFGQSEALCTSEPFYNQGTAGFCSGFLVNENTIITAGHCISSASECSSARFVFGFNMKTAGQNPNQWEIPSTEIYRCQTVVHSVSIQDGEDFAVIKLDRPVQNHKPVSYRTTGSPAVGEKLTVMGYPSGLPLKIAGGAAVRAMTDSFLTANLDTYGGNSGSAVFDTQTGTVEGVLVRGETDFVIKNGCYVSNRCPDNGCRGEDATLMSKVIPYL